MAEGGKRMREGEREREGKRERKGERVIKTENCHLTRHGTSSYVLMLSLSFWRWR